MASATGFPAETLEQVFRLMSLLDGLNAHPFLKPRIALKGGTALNLFVFDVPRLSVDIDLNYIGAAARETMLDERPKVEQAVRAVCSRDGLPIKRMPSEHAGGKWRLAYTRSTGDSGNLELDVNFMLRVPLWEPVFTECRPVGSFRAAPARVLEPHELAAGKLAALLARSASRDIFDARRPNSWSPFRPPSKGAGARGRQRGRIQHLQHRSHPRAGRVWCGSDSWRCSQAPRRLPAPRSRGSSRSRSASPNMLKQ